MTFLIPTAIWRQTVFRTRLLTWLFIAASIAIDAAVIAKSRYPSDYGGLLSGLVLGQVGALAIWAASGTQHRLSRAGVLVVATAAIAVLTGREAVRSIDHWLGLLSGYALLACLVSLLVDLFKKRLAARRSPPTSSTRWQIPLIEIFGWTIVVALISFGARHMEFAFLDRGARVYVTMAGILLVVGMAKVSFAEVFTRWELLKSLLFVAATYAIAQGIVYQRGRARLLVTVMVAQAAYLAVWFLVQSIEARGTDQQAVESDDDPSLRLFDAKD